MEFLRILVIFVTTLISTVTCNTRCDEDIVGFRKLGIYHATDVHGNKFIKVFYLSMDFEANWMDARSFCKTFDMDLATFESSYEFSHFLKKALSHKSSFDRWTHIGGISKLINNNKNREWYWISTNKKVPFILQFATGQPNNFLGRQNCLGISKEELTFEFQDIDCHGRFEEKFICQKICPSLI